MAQVGVAVRENAVPENSFYTGEFTFSASTNFLTPHGLPRVPKQVWLEIRCVTAELGYAVGDRVQLTNSSIIAVSVNATNIQVTFAAAPLQIVSFATNALATFNAANWILVVKAEVA
jgi:hypothetical protein